MIPTSAEPIVNHLGPVDGVSTRISYSIRALILLYEYPDKRETIVT